MSKAVGPEVKKTVEALEALAGALSSKDHEFAKSLLHGDWGYYTRGFLTERQYGWVEYLLLKAMLPDEKHEVPEALKTDKMKANEPKKSGSNRGSNGHQLQAVPPKKWAKKNFKKLHSSTDEWSV